MDKAGSHNVARDTHQNAIPYRTADERAAEGRAIRNRVSRSSQAGWELPKERRDLVELLVESNEGRLPVLAPIRFGRMSASPFAFYRGAAALMAADLATTPTSGIRVQACGDAHLMNFGGFATPERNIIFDINDLDETLPAPFEWDLKRLAASVVIAAQHLELPASDTARVATDLVREYRERMHDYAEMRALDVWYDKIDLQKYEDRSADPAVIAAVRRRIAERIEVERRKQVPDHLYPKLVSQEGAQPRIKDLPPLIFHPTEEIAPGLESGYAEAIASYRESLAEHVRILFDRFHLVDLALKVVGVGSVGTMCAVGLFMASDNDPLFLQVKEARASVLEPYAGKSLHPNHGQRVIAGQRLMQTASDVFLGWTRGKNGRDFYLRQLRDMKMSVVLEDWDTGMLRQYARMCAHALARAHARSGDAAMMAGYMGSGQTFDDAITEFATEYSSQNRRDYREFIRAIREGRILARTDE
ncbi:Uncharacterized conserved protein, DUF2252 family [Paraburkholderia steynii]|uniref:Uncharacterized conserved protein, DUF2252 family n=1 Tax=Paraburkholderia steynii TaxID=1245441 RepID=A0A7Z7BJ65_9BURK|nr:DUF2252 domain-containing protein [Paraburkholderia steynii]SDJ35148.1 Uncharacterized conserved protein, DUF2252 family [Paraburkholderia steynii]